jgi:two-component system sensor histidine kinase PhoQ
LADLAHSLKTPLAIVRGLVITPEFNQETRNSLQAQVSRMDDIVEYQLKRAAAKGQKKIAGSVDGLLVLNKIVGALSKVYADKAIEFEIICTDQTLIYCEEGDLYEIAGNLIDNAGKWCQKKIKITLESLEKQAVKLVVEDDGPGIPEQKLDSILKRGIRADENIKGHGIGMAIVNELVTLLGGKLQGERSAALGGMKWVVYL